MPEGPTIVILRDETVSFVGKTVRSVAGNSKLDLQRMQGRRIKSLRSWGKHFLIEFSGFTMRVHFMLFGSYRINGTKPAAPRMSLKFDHGEMNFYSCSLKYVEGDLDDAYDWTGDVMSDRWDAAAARSKLVARPGMLVCDALLSQDIFAGVGNIIKNEVLFRIRLHPLNTVGQVPSRKLTQMIGQARRYSFEFLAWKKEFFLKKHLLVHNRSVCPRCDIPLKRAHLGVTNRRSFFCENCQVRYE